MAESGSNLVYFLVSSFLFNSDFVLAGLATLPSFVIGSWKKITFLELRLFILIWHSRSVFNALI